MESQLARRVESALGCRLRSAQPVSGGSIARSYRIETDEGCFFLKTGTGKVAQTFRPEAKGLREMRGAGASLRIPEPVALEVPKDASPAFLALPWIEERRADAASWEALGRGLAELHRHTADRYGFSSDNFIGRIPQQNEPLDNWSDFFWERRLEPQIQRARDAEKWESSWDRHADNLKQQLAQILPPHPSASLIHGDLWSGNVMSNEEGGPVVLDPAVYYGHREADLALTELFGGFGRRFYEAYREVSPLDGGYEDRREIYNLYHLINHLNHFGAGYASRVARILKRF